MRPIQNLKFIISFSLLIAIFPSFSQAQNIGINTDAPASTLEVKGNGDTDATSAFNVTNVNGNSLLFVRDDGRVGIGVTAPGAQFMVQGAGMTDASATMNIINSANTSLFHIKDDGKIGLGTTSPGARFMIVGQSGAPILNILTDAANPMTPALRINDNGRVGVGLTAPGAKFMVQGEGTDDGSVAMNIVNNDGTAALTVRDNTHVGVGTTTPGAKFMVVGEMGAPALNILATSGSTPSLRVNDNGRVGIGTTAPNYELEVVGDINATGNVRANGMVLSSDKRYKMNIANLSNSLVVISQLRGTQYFWKDQSVSERLQMGFIAQEIEKVLPHLVFTDENGYKAVNYIALIPVMTEAIKDQQKTIEAQKQINEKQDLRIEKLENELAEIKAMLQKK